MNIRPKWLKDICSMLFSAYYLAYASEGDEVVSDYLLWVQWIAKTLTIAQAVPRRMLCGNASDYMGEDKESLCES